jgi:hypothetical protein
MSLVTGIASANPDLTFRDIASAHRADHRLGQLVGKTPARPARKLGSVSH